MNYFSSSVSRDELKNPLETKTPSIIINPRSLSVEAKAAVALLPYALPSLITQVSSVKRGRGKRNQKKLVMPKLGSTLLDNKPYRFVDQTEVTSINSAAISTYGAINITFGQFGDATPATLFFDQYRIALIEINFLPRVDVNVTPSTNPGQFYSVVDYDDSTVPGTVNVLQDYQNLIVTEGTKHHLHTFVPHVAVAAYAGAFTSYMNVTAPWIDVASPNVQHYGVKYAWTGGTVGFTYDIIARVLMELRNAR